MVPQVRLEHMNIDKLKKGNDYLICVCNINYNYVYILVEYLNLEETHVPLMAFGGINLPKQIRNIRFC